MIKTIERAVLLLFAGAAAGILLLTFVYILPVNPENGHVKESQWILETEGWYPSLPLIKAHDGGAIQVINSGGTLDNFTDGIMVSMASVDAEGAPFHKAVEMQGYSYYWHGYVTILRPLLMVMDYGDIRVLNQMLQLALIVYLACLLYRKKGLSWALLAVSVYILLMPMAVAVSLQYSWVFYIGILGTILVVRFDCFADEKNFWLLTFCLGLLTAYFDLLTYPLFTWGIPAVWWIVMDREDRGEWRRIRALVISGLFWIGGYGGMWSLKWVLGELFLEKNVIASAWYEVKYRSGTAPESDGRDMPRWYSIVSNWRMYENIQTVTLLACWYLWAGMRFLKQRASLKTGKSLSLLLVGLSSFTWYFVVYSHTLVHGFAYRIYNITFTALLALMILAVEGGAGQRASADGKRKWSRWAVPAILLGASGAIALIHQESFWIHNGANEREWTELKEGQILEQNIYPAYSHLDKLQVDLLAQGELSGYYEVRLLQGEELIRQAKIMTAEAADGSFCDIPLNLDLKAGECYTLTLEVKDAENTRCQAALTKDGTLALQECPLALVDGKVLNGQLICGFVYQGMSNMKRLLLEFFTAAGILLSLYLCALQLMAARDGKREKPPEAAA